MRCQPVERVHNDVAPAHVAAAEAGQLGPELVVLAVHDVPGDVRYPTMVTSPSRGRAVKVEPVVPVKRTRA